MNYYYFFLYLVLRLVKKVKLKRYAHRSLEDATNFAFVFINIWILLYVLKPLIVFNSPYLFEILFADEKSTRYLFYFFEIVPIMLIQYFTYFHNERWIGIYRKYHKLPKKKKIKHTIILTSLLFIVVTASVVFDIIYTIPFIRSH